GVATESGPVDGSLFTLQLTGITITVADGAVSIANGNLGVAVVTSGANSYVAAHGDSFALTLTAGALTGSGTVAFTYNSGPSTGHEISDWAFAGVTGLGDGLADDLVEVNGNNVTVALGTLFSTSVSTFDLVTKSVTGVATESGPVDGSLFTLQLTGITITVANGAVSIANGNLGVAVVTSGANSYVAAHGDSFALTLTAGALTGSGTVAFTYNSGPSTGHEISNWAFAGVTGLGNGLPDDLVEVSGNNVTVALGTLFSTSVSTFDLVTKSVTG